ncbi:class I SAM-dependent methyltransferase [Ensifer soli]|uniref:class I SAM-dependent methyltransferase n=1 Tax=Ciceribacter sp. sgz301302 TaxID=3342379 RepID=UPI0035B7126A
MTPAAGDHAGRMDRMYRYQRHIYDVTRKYYLFGRDRMIAGLAPPPGASVLEVGCGTGRNLARIARRYPGVRLFGLDISAEMLVSARASLARSGRPDARLLVADATDFEAGAFGEDGFDRVVVSYALSMIPDWQQAIDTALRAVRPGGALHIADFGMQEGLPSAFGLLLRGWLGRFHVTPRETLPAVLRDAAARHGMTVEITDVGRGYALVAVCRKQIPH